MRKSRKWKREREKASGNQFVHTHSFVHNSLSIATVDVFGPRPQSAKISNFLVPHHLQEGQTYESQEDRRRVALSSGSLIPEQPSKRPCVFIGGFREFGVDEFVNVAWGRAVP